ncbi:MAG: tetratricopeptide repeat protein [Alphaproteobacteria bacterium]|nr:tetratricopeptide repeat protein [Alphaproteobacteria bacterium]
MKTLTILALLALAACATAEPPRQAVPMTAAVDALFERLRATASAEEAEALQLAILDAFQDSGRDDVDTLVGAGLAAVQEGQPIAAIALFSEVVERAPTFAEGWNLRGLAHFINQDYADALEDLRRALVLEPRHFGALVGLGRTLEELGHRDLALEALRAALVINPHLAEARAYADGLEEQLAGVAI